MRKQDIKAGVVYAYQRSREYGSPEPVVFLVAPSENKVYATTSTYRKPGAPAFTEARAGSKPQRGGGLSGTTYGYPVAKLKRHIESPVTPADLLRVTLADFEACATAYSPAGFDGVEFDLVTTLTHITGEYEAEIAAHEARREAERAESKRERAAIEAARARADAITDALSTLDVDAEAVSKDRQHWSHVCISVADAEKLIALLRDREG